MFDGYLCSPYSVIGEDDPAIREQRFMEAVLATGWAHRQGIMMYSPIAHTHPIATHCKLPTGFDFWRRYDEAGILACRQVYLLVIPGWNDSKGILHEMALAVKHKKSVLLLKKQLPGVYRKETRPAKRIYEEIITHQKKGNIHA